MNKVVTINLAGNAYQLEEGAYDALRRYLDQAREKLADNPDVEEIITDLEAAVAQKCSAYLTAQKTVIAGADMEAILSQMGPVDGAQASSNDEKSKEQTSHKRLYRLPEQEVIGGVCAGLAAYFGVDPTLVRVLFIILAVLTSGAWIAVYILMMIFIPVANTPQTREWAYGAGATAQELIDRATKAYQEGMSNLQRWHTMHDAHKLKAQMKAQRTQLKHQWRAQQRHYTYAYNYQYKRSPFWEFMGSLLGLVWLAFFGFLLWLGYTHVPAIHTLLLTLGSIAGSWLDRFSAWLQLKLG